MQVRSLGWEDTLGDDIATHSNSLTWRIPWTEKPGRLQSIVSQRIGHYWNNLAHSCSFCIFFKEKLLSAQSGGVLRNTFE